MYKQLICRQRLQGTFLHIEGLLPRGSGSQRDQVLALTATTASATALRSFFQRKQRPANAEAAVKVAGATAQHSIVLHGASSFLGDSARSPPGENEEAYTRANVGCSRSTDVVVLASPIQTLGIPGALQVIATLLHRVYVIRAEEGKELQGFGYWDSRKQMVAISTQEFAAAMLPRPMWGEQLPACVCEFSMKLDFALALRSLQTQWCLNLWQVLLLFVQHHRWI